jgi:hypothetical protein
VRALAFDRWRMDVLKAELARIGIDDAALPLKEFGQGFRDMSPAIDSLEANLLNKRIRHGMHPILTWNAAERHRGEGSGREPEDGQVEGDGAHRRPGGARDGDRHGGSGRG